MFNLFKKRKRYKAIKSLGNHGSGFNEETRLFYYGLDPSDCMDDIVPDETYYGRYIFTGKTYREAWIKACNATLYMNDRVVGVPDDFRFWCPACGKEGEGSQYQCNCSVDDRIKRM